MKKMGKMSRLSIAAAVGQAAWGTRQQWQAMHPRKRQRMQELIRQAASGPSSLSPRDRGELRELFAELNLGEVARSSAARVARGYGRRA
jgi:hypothetical protein